MTLNCVKLGRAVIFMKYLTSVVSLIFLAKSLVWNKITFPASNLLNFSELEKNGPLKGNDLSLLTVKISRANN